MQYKQLSYSVSQKLNCGNYESRGIAISATAELDESDDLTECKAELSEKINQLLEEEIIREKQLLIATSRR